MSELSEVPPVAGEPGAVEAAAGSTSRTGTASLSVLPAPGTFEDPAEALRVQVAQLVVAHPGVLRMEPTLLGALHSLRQGGSLDGIQLDVHGRVVDLDVNVSTRASHQARASVIELHRMLRELVAAHGFVPGSVEISVLAVEETG
ncbi:hypothetical protein [Microlunatus antarcticus]|uniref:Asp23 family, cell envelope-related function n=1 Tax=Microlunatus antarcticus TaxID=53388 RepID=A0A7W5JWF3_9ACTN|nr:hypothetical protein [Microlunatus antarcticus]MBB3327430.1 hypothetical protein [Microlunatus antarcticus]